MQPTSYQVIGWEYSCFSGINPINSCVTITFHLVPPFCQNLIFHNLLDRLPWHLVIMFMLPRGWTISILLLLPVEPLSSQNAKFEHKIWLTNQLTAMIYFWVHSYWPGEGSFWFWWRHYHSSSTTPGATCQIWYLKIYRAMKWRAHFCYLKDVPCQHWWPNGLSVSATLRPKYYKNPILSLIAFLQHAPSQQGTSCEGQLFFFLVFSSPSQRGPKTWW